MWSRRLALTAVLALAACGFEPVYGPGGAGTRLQGQVRVADPQTADDYAFLRRLTERLGPEEAARYELAYALRIATVSQAITPDEVTTRYSLNGTAAYALTDSATGAVVAQGEVSNFSSHSTVGTVIATNAAEQDARNRLAVMLADQVVTRLLATVPAAR
ncbi:LPS assembly lipoprotein LptE [Paracoccus sp. (in: a-proteobacteria)]|uniref:LPS assembly lipoprotein LptE n=1 Tax=Paracoccus sp. TaxID=267 RepID=UPI0026E0BD92|nr:LPS assembly lipoprotein LptE [Paracoccus sp. (in: a-proteobacteria)]MDO5368805.1 LPS assembly lipoprotein LptE [Paracoccus sp. (in: a-proteobacteria)]